MSWRLFDFMADFGEAFLSLVDNAFTRKPFGEWGYPPATFKVGDKVKLNGCPFDEQIIEEVMMFAWLVSQTMTVTRVSSPLDMDVPYDDKPSEPGRWIKTDLMPDWTASTWFKKED